MSFVGSYLESPEEYIVNDNKYLIVIPNYTMMEKYNENFVMIVIFTIQVTTHGKLRILFDEQFQIEIYEFVSLEHKEFPTKDNNNSSKIQ